MPKGSSIAINNSPLNSDLAEFLLCDDHTPGDDPSYQMCKIILSAHPLGQKMAEAPLVMAQSQKREISIPGGPEDDLRKAFEAEWKRVGADKHIRNFGKLARAYGVATIIVGAVGVDPSWALKPEKYADYELYFNVLDPLNTAGSLVLNQDPNSPDFQKHTAISVAGTPYHRSRAVVLMNEQPIYLDYTNSAYGYVGRSVYQRAIYPLKSFVQTMIADDMISQKLGLLIAKIKQPGSIIDNLMQGAAALKREMLKGGRTGNVLSVQPAEDITTLNMMNVDGAGKYSRDNILKNIATAADMPAAMLNQETMAEGFGEGTEDAKNIARWVDGIREWIQPGYDFFDPIVMRRAWNPEFYKTIQAKYPAQYGKKGYTQAFYEWSNAFTAVWPNLLKEPDSELAKAEDVAQKAIIATLETMGSMLDPMNKATLVEWAANCLNEMKLLFKSELVLDYEALANYDPVAEAAALADPEAPEPESERS